MRRTEERKRGRGGDEQQRIYGRGSRQHVAGCIGSPSSTRISLGRGQDPTESISTITCELFYTIVSNLSKKISFI